MSIRRLAAIIFTDIAGYTALMQEDERRTAVLRSRHRQVLEKLNEEYNGEIIQYYGDGSLSLFNSAIEAVECAIATQKELKTEPEVPLRIGIHLGDVVREDGGDVFGDGVNLASRIEGLGIAGNILLSGRVNQELKNHPRIETQSLGHFEFKNVKAPVEVFAVVNPGIPVPKREELKGKLARRKKTLAVLPFVNMSADPENEYFSDGISEEILNALVKVEGLQVTARTSSFAFKGKKMDVREIGRILSVANILEGSVRKAGKRVRITAQLINTADGYHRFSETYDRDLEDIFAVQDEIAQKVTLRLREHLQENEYQRRIVQAPTHNLNAYEAYLKGLYEFNRWGDQASIRAKPYFEEAIRLQEDFASPHAYLSVCYLFLAFGGMLSWSEAYVKGIVHIERALELDPDSVDAYSSLGAFQTFCEWDWKALEKTVDKLQSLNPAKGTAYHVIATYYNIMGNVKKAIAIEKAGLKVDPLSVQLNLYLGFFHTWTGEYEEAGKYLDKVLKLASGHRTALEWKGFNLAFQGHFEEALSHFRKMEPEAGYRFHRLTGLGYVYARQKKKEKAEECLAKIKELEKKAVGSMLTLDLAVLLTALGQTDQAFQQLEKALELRIGDSMMFHIDPLFAPLRKDPRFKALKEKAGVGG